ncbi:DUF2934 domain-containing protein [Methylocapsa sp. S129]|uniref:DUF2934 domain-containing protein n=1 Tax=Methylocapsa sp. S129 TaxID=1641869 RepID=UPI00131CBDDD|nr:DUF2934 domain-containing protein [Methylocapsa sp. S129]
MANPEQASNDEEKIKARAYAIWEEEGRPEGGHLEHWRRAELEVGAAAPPTAPTETPQPIPPRNGKGKI